MEQDLTPPHRRGSDRARLARAAVGRGLAATSVAPGAVLISGAASADTPSPPAAAPSGSAPAPRMSPPGGLGMPGGRFGMGALDGELGQLGIGPGSQPLHGTVVVEKRDGGYQTLAAQRGTERRGGHRRRHLLDRRGRVRLRRRGGAHRGEMNDACHAGPDTAGGCFDSRPRCVSR